MIFEMRKRRRAKMKSKFPSEQGYTLFITVLLVVLFATLALSLMTFTMSGMTKTSTRNEVIQANELAEKGVKHLTHHIRDELQKKLDSEEHGLSEAEFEAEFHQLLDEYACDTGKKIEQTGETGTYEACVKSDSYKKIEDMPKPVEFEGKGFIDDREKTIVMTVEMGGDLIPDFLKYAVSSYKTENCRKDKRSCFPGEGNLFLHGGVSVAGDIKVDGDLITTNRSFKKYKLGSYWIHSYFPSAKPLPNGQPPHLVLLGDTYNFEFKSDKFKQKDFNYNEHLKRTDFSKGIYNKVDSITEAFVGGEAPTLVHRKPLRSEIPIRKEIENARFGMSPPLPTKEINTSIFQSDGITREIKNQHYPNHLVIPHYRNNYKGRFNIVRDNEFGQFRTKGELQIGGVVPTKTDRVTFHNGAYIQRDLTIGKKTGQITSYKSEVKGAIFVDGDLTINKANAKFDALIYVNGDVTIRHSRFNQFDNGEGSLIIFANGKITIERNNRFEDDPATLRGFFYSKEGIVMSGNEMNVRIEGGISAPHIVLNSIRGRSRWSGEFEFPMKGAQHVETRYFEGWKEQAKRDSRLQIVYNPDIIRTYSDLQPEKRIYNTVPPKVLERTFE